MTELNRIAVLGAGYIGSAVARALAATGASVYTVRRTPQPPSAGITTIAGDLASGSIAGLPGQLDAIVLAVAPSRSTDGYDAVYPPAARTAVALARSTGAKSVVYTSSTGVYGGRDGEWMLENSARAGEGPGNRALIDAEDTLIESGLTGVSVLRVAGIYGPGRDPRGRFASPGVLPSRGDYWVNLAHQFDIVAAIMLSLQYEEAPRALNVADGSPTKAADVARWVAESRGIDPVTLVFGNDGAPSRSNQRIANAALIAAGWQAKYPSFREGFTSGL